MELENVYGMEFVVIKLDTTDKPEETSLQDIWGLSAINEQGEILEIEGEDNRELGWKDYLRVRNFIGDRPLYFDDPCFYQSFLFASAYSGVAILNLWHWLSGDLGVYLIDKRFAKHPKWQEDEREYLEAMREIILSGFYFDGFITMDVRNNHFIAEGDVTGPECRGLPRIMECGLTTCRDIFEGRGVFGENISSLRNVRCIINLYAPSDAENAKFYELITTDGEGDPACGGLFPILNDPELARLYKEHGLSYFSDWHYSIWGVFSKDTDIEVVKSHLKRK